MAPLADTSPVVPRRHRLSDFDLAPSGYWRQGFRAGHRRRVQIIEPPAAASGQSLQHLFIPPTRGQAMNIPIPPETPDSNIDDPSLPPPVPEDDPDELPIKPTMPPTVGDPPSQEPPVKA